MVVLALLSQLGLVESLPAGIQERQEFTGIWAHDFTTFGCKPIIFIYAKETIAPGNVVCRILQSPAEFYRSCPDMSSLAGFLGRAGDFEPVEAVLWQAECGDRRRRLSWPHRHQLLRRRRATHWNWHDADAAHDGGHAVSGIPNRGGGVQVSFGGLNIRHSDSDQVTTAKVPPSPTGQSSIFRNT
jgi:hypothetical protein